MYDKIYPNQRLLFLLFDSKSKKKQVIVARMRRTEEYLASHMDEVDLAWASRYREENKVPHMFDHHVTGAVDTFPVCISRPTDSWWQKKMYNGKYGTQRPVLASACHA